MLRPEPLEIRVGDSDRLRALRWRAETVVDDTPNILMLHGLGDGADVWRPVVENLPSGTFAEITAIDFPGHGGSARLAPDQYDLGVLVDAISKVIPTLRNNNLIVVGHSLGGSVGCALAGAVTKLIDGLILVDVNPWPTRSGGNSVEAHIDALLLMAKSEGDLIERILGRLPLADPDVVAQVVPKLLQARRRVRADSVSMPLDPEIKRLLYRTEKSNAIPSLRRSEIPIGIIKGAVSAVLDEESHHALAAELKTCVAIEQIPLAGHAIPFEQPRALAEKLGLILGRIRRLETCP